METITDRLKEPFAPNRIHWRVGATTAKKEGVPVWQASKGIALAYIDARDVMKRLDDVCGDGWQAKSPYKGYCEVGLKVDGEWLWRGNGAGETDVEGEKGQYSDAFKRAAVLWGIGRYLYMLPNVWCELDNGKIKKPPTLPEWATPEGYARRFKAGEANNIREQVRAALVLGDVVGLKQVVDEYIEDKDPEEAIKFWALFTSSENAAIKKYL